MAYKVKINHTDVFDLKDGFIIKEEFNENLDSGTVQFSSFSESIDIEPFDHVEIYDTENKIAKKTFDVDTADEEVYSFNNGLDNSDKFNTVMMFSQTKELERITLPNCSVTQPTSGTKKTVYEEIVRFITLFVRKVKIYDHDQTSRYHMSPEYKIDNAVYTRFGNVECPEFQWNNPTLREVLNDLMSTQDCIVVVRDNVISYFDLKERGNEIDTTKLSYSKKSIGSADYCTDLTINMKNAIGRNKTVVCEKKGLRTTEAELTTNNAVFIAQHPIYNIISCKVSYFYHYYQSEVHREYHREVDITDFIVESDIYDTKISGDRPPYASTPEAAREYQAFLLKFKRGENQIEEWFSPVYANQWTTTAMGKLNLILQLLGEAISDPNDVVVYDDLTAKFNNIAIDLVYETVSEHNLHAGRYLPTRHFENRLFDNQSNSYVDANHQSIFEYAKVNRLGNHIREIKGTYFNENDIPRIGDTIGDEVLFETEVEYLDGQFEFIGHLTKNFVLRDYFTGVLAKKRSWELAKDSEALTRQDIEKYYIEASFNKKRESLLYAASNFAIDRFSNALSGYESDQAFDYALVKTKDDANNYRYSEYVWFMVDLNAEAQGMSLVFEFGAMDNVLIDYIVDANSNKSQMLTYTDGKGEFVYLYFILTDYVDPGKTISNVDFEWPESGEYTEEQANEIITKTNSVLRSRPLYYAGSVGGEIDGYKIRDTLTKYKDNRERIRQTIQLEYCSDTKDIVITERFIELCSAINNNSLDADSLKVYSSATDEYKIIDRTPLGSIQADWFVQRIIDGNLNARIQLGRYADATNKTITNLAGTKWKFNETIDLDSLVDIQGTGQDIGFEINFESNGETFDKMYAYSLPLLPLVFYYVSGQNLTAAKGLEWNNPKYRVIEITSGTDATNTDLINWLKANAKLVENYFVESIESWGVADADGNLLIGVNASTQKEVYLNLLKSRDDNIYYGDTDRRIVGKMYESASTLDNRYNSMQSNNRTIRISRSRVAEPIDIEDLEE